MNKKIRQTAFILAAVGMMASLTGCGEDKEQKTSATAVPVQTVNYEETDFIPLPEEGFYWQDTLNISSIERDVTGNTAVYMMESGMDDMDQPYAQVLQYSLTSKKEWEMKVICDKSLTKMIHKSKGKSFTMPYIVRGDDGNLYALLQQGGSTKDTQQAEREYSVLLLSEDKDNVMEIKLDLVSASNKDIDFSKQEVSKFHVMEDGTPFIVFEDGSAVQFDADNGSQTAVCSNVPDDAFDKNVGYGEKEFNYYSSTNKLLSTLDLDTMTVTKTFGAEIDESIRGKEWYFDTHTDDWQMYAFNSSGLYRIMESGKKSVLSRISQEGSFDNITTGVTIYDVQVDAKENVLLLIRKKAENASGYDSQWDFGIIEFEAGHSEN